MMFCSVIYITGKFGIVYKAYYKPEENTIIEVAIKTLKCVLLKFLSECSLFCYCL